MKVLLEILIKVIFGLVIILILLFLSVNFAINQQEKIRNGESYCKNKEFSIGSPFNNKDLYFCDSKIKGKCLDGIIKSTYVDENQNLYVYFTLGKFIGKTDNEINKDILEIDNPKGYIYNLFMNDYSNKYYAKNYNDIIVFLTLENNSCTLKFYSENELKNLSQEQQNIFKDLEKNPKIIINGVDYTK